MASIAACAAHRRSIAASSRSISTGVGPFAALGDAGGELAA